MTPPAAVRAESVEASGLSALAERLPTKSLAIYIAVFLVVWSLRATVFIYIDESIQSEVWRNLYSNAVKFTLWALPVFITLAFLHDKPLTYTKLTTHVNKRGLLISAVVLVIWLSLVVLGEASISGRNIGAMLSQRSPLWLSILAAAFFSPISEEILFRGFFLNRLNESLSFRRSNVIAAILFMLVHVPYWVSKNGFPGRVTRDLVNV